MLDNFSDFTKYIISFLIVMLIFFLIFVTNGWFIVGVFAIIIIAILTRIVYEILFEDF